MMLTTSLVTVIAVAAVIGRRCHYHDIVDMCVAAAIVIAAAVAVILVM